MTNLDYLSYCAAHPEPLLDPHYDKGLVVIPPTPEEMNGLTAANARLVELISAFNVLRSPDRATNEESVRFIVEEVVAILDGTPHINFSAFSQFFMVYNFAYSSYARLHRDEKLRFVRAMLERYCEERHGLYLRHGYSNAILQVVADNYSHKRNSKTSIDKILGLLAPFGIARKDDESFDDGSPWYLLPAKGDKFLFETFRARFSIALESARTEQDKLPDMVLKIGAAFHIVEMKNIKGAGGGQDKQMTEVINFIRHSERNPHIRYLVFLDGEYANLLFEHRAPKMAKQFADIERCLRDNPRNLFLNTAGFEKYLSDIFVNPSE